MALALLWLSQLCDLATTCLSLHAGNLEANPAGWPGLLVIKGLGMAGITAAWFGCSRWRRPLSAALYVGSGALLLVSAQNVGVAA